MSAYRGPSPRSHEDEEQWLEEWAKRCTGRGRDGGWYMRWLRRQDERWLARARATAEAFIAKGKVTVGWFSVDPPI